MKSPFLIAALLAAGPFAGGLSSSPLAMEDYLEQVRQGNEALRGSQAEDAALALSAKQPLTAYSPQFASNFQYMDNQELPAGATVLNPADTESLSWDANLNKLFSTGTKVGIDYSGDKTRIGFPGLISNFLASNPADQAFLPAYVYYGQQASVSVTQPLWRNFMADEVEAGLAKARADSDSARASNRYQAQALVFQARQAYAQLVTLRQVADILRESLDRNQKILEWTRHKFDDNLADRVDVLQCEAALRQVEFNLAQNKEDESKELVVFNTLRGATPTAKAGDLVPLDVPSSLPAPANTRRDLEAAQAALRSSDAAVSQVEQQFTPDVSVFANLGEGERIWGPGDASDHYRPDTIVGVKVNANLDVLLYHQVLAGAKKARGYGEDAVADKKRQLAMDWRQLEEGFSGVMERLSLARELETLQKEKADREKVRYQNGDTTDFQVLRFEDDYNLSRVQTLELTAQAKVLEAQARFYNGDDQPW